MKRGMPPVVDGQFIKGVGGKWTAAAADPEGVTAGGAAVADEIAAASGGTTTEKLVSKIGPAGVGNSGVVELATASEAAAGEDTGRPLTPGTLKAALDAETMWLPKRTRFPSASPTPILSVLPGQWSTAGWSMPSGLAGMSAATGNLRATGLGNTKMIFRRSLAGPCLIWCKMVDIPLAQTFLTINAAGNLWDDWPLYRADGYMYALAIWSRNLAVVDIGVRFAAGADALDKIFELVELSIFSTLPAIPSGSISDLGCKVATQLATTPGGSPIAATATVTSNGTNVSDGDSVTVHSKQYVFKTTLGTTEGQIQIGATYDASLGNLAAAINHAGTPGSDYYCAAAHPTVAAVAAGAILAVSARSAGIHGNQIPLAKSAATLTLSGSVLSGGIDDVGNKIITQVQNRIAGGGTRPAAAKVELADTGLIGYETTVDVAESGTLTLPSGGTWIWNVYGYGATINSAKRGSSAGGTTLTVTGANASVGYRRYA